jgi:hypothetical protein
MFMQILLTPESEPPVTGFIIPYIFSPPELDESNGSKRQYFIIEGFGTVY